MKKSLYFIIQMIWSVIVMFVVGYITLAIAYGGNNPTMAGTIFSGGLLFYLVITFGYIIFGYKKVDGWGIWVVLICLVLSSVAAFGGLFLSSIVPDLFH